MSSYVCVYACTDHRRVDSDIRSWKIREIDRRDFCFYCPEEKEEEIKCVAKKSRRELSNGWRDRIWMG